MKTKSVNIFLGFLASVGMLVHPGCATPASSSRTDEAFKQELMWPLPPDKPRIRFIQTVSAPADLGVRTSGWEQIFGFLAGKKQDFFGLPQQIACHRSKILCVTDQRQKCVHVFDLDKRRYSRLKKFGKEPFHSPAGVAIDNNSRIYVSDSIRRKIFVFNPKGKPLFSFGGPAVLERPTGMMFVSDTQKLYVADTLAQNLKVFNSEGNFVFQFGERGEEEGNFNYPTNVAYDGDSRIYVTDTLNHRIQAFDIGGTFLTSFGQAGDAYGSFSRPKGIAVDSRGNVYVVDALHDVVQIFNMEGRMLLSFSGPGSSPGELWLPSGIAIDNNNRIYVADTYNRRIQIFELLPENDMK